MYFEIATVLFECMLIHIFFNGWFGLKNSRRSKVAIFMALYFLLQCIISLLPLFPALRSIISYFLVLGIAAVLYDTKQSTAMYSSFLYIALAVISEYLCFTLLSALSFDVDNLLSSGSTRMIYLSLAKTVHFFVVLITATVLRKNRVTLTLKQVIPLIPCLAISIYICIVFFWLFPDNDDSLTAMLIMAPIGLLYINGIIVLNTQLIKTTTFENEEQKLAVQQYEMQEHYYSSIVIDREETRALWHDVKKYITAIETLVESGEIQHAVNEYNHIRQVFDEVGNVIDVENSALNAILHHNIGRAKSKNIFVSLDAHVPPEIPISAVDLSVIIGNTFDNAIEECVTLVGTDPQINVALMQLNQMLFYEIANPCKRIPHNKAGKFHGYGLRNVQRCVEKYNGSMKHGMTDGYYTVSIRLNCSVADSVS